MQPEPISTFSDGCLSIRGIPIEELIWRNSFIETLILTLTGTLPKPLDPRVNLISSILVAWVDHGEAPPSTQNVRNAASVGAPFHAAAASGFMCFGEMHSPVEAAARLFAGMVSKECDRDALIALIPARVPGFGHPVHREADPRSELLLVFAVNLGVAAKHTTAMSFIRTRILMYPNLAGVTAALWLDMGFSVETVGLIPIVGRSVGLAAHYQDQRRNHPPFKGTPP